MLWTLKGKLQDKITEIEKQNPQFLEASILRTVCAVIYFYIFGI